jgi:hypothetical protein
MLLHVNATTHQPLLVYNEAVLDKKSIMIIVIAYVEMAIF